MSITYALYPNKVSKTANSFRALIKNRNKYDLNSIIDQIVARRAGVTRGEVLQTLELFMSEIEYILEEGGVISTDLFQAECSISGNFKGTDDHFYPSRHEIKVNLRPGKRLKNLSKKIKAHRVNGHVPAPYLLQFTDMSNVSINKELTPGSSGLIQGKRLQFDASDANQGIFLTHNESHQSFKVEEVFVNTFSQLIIKIPESLLQGSYQLEVRSNLKTKTIRTGYLDNTLHVS